MSGPAPQPLPPPLPDETPTQDFRRVDLDDPAWMHDDLPGHIIPPAVITQPAPARHPEPVRITLQVGIDVTVTVRTLSPGDAT